MRGEKYEEALNIFEFLDNYKDSSSLATSCKEKITEEKYNDAIELLDAEKYDDAIVILEALNGYKDSEDRIKQCNDALTEIKYQNAVNLYNAGQYEEAITLFAQLGEYKNSSSFFNLAKIKIAKAGDVIAFGSYEQDNNLSNGEESIEWIVLDKKDGKLFVLSKQILDWMQYSNHDSWEETSWDNCSIRTWLNNDFYNSAFSSEEQKQILTTNVELDEYTYNISGISKSSGSATKDRLFLLGMKEYETYCTIQSGSEYGGNEISKGVRTEYALQKAKSLVESYISTYDTWWLRYRSEKYDSCVSAVDTSGLTTNNESLSYAGIRPAMWISIP